MTMLRCCQKDEFDFMLCEMSTQMYIHIYMCMAYSYLIKMQFIQL